MGWSIKLSGGRAEAKSAAASASATLVTAGAMTQAQATLVQSIIDATPGEVIGGYVSGYNAAEQAVGGGYIAAHVTGNTPAP